MPHCHAPEKQLRRPHRFCRMGHTQKIIFRRRNRNYRPRHRRHDQSDHPHRLRRIFGKHQQTQLRIQRRRIPRLHDRLRPRRRKP